MKSQITCLLTVLVPAILVALVAMGLNWYLKDTHNNHSATDTTSKVIVLDQSSYGRPARGFNAQPQPYTNLDPTQFADDGTAEAHKNNNTDGLAITDSQILGVSQPEVLSDKHTPYVGKTGATLNTAQSYEQKSKYPSFQGTVEGSETQPQQSVIFSENKNTLPLQVTINPTPTLEQDTSSRTSPVLQSDAIAEGQPGFIPTSIQPTGTQTQASSTAVPSGDMPTQHCWDDLTSGTRVCKPNCNTGTFGLPYMEECHHWLTCQEINADVIIVKLIGEGSTKKVYKGLWKGHQVAVSVLRSAELQPDFQHGGTMLRQFHQQQGFVQFVGGCEDSNVLVTEFHRLGNLGNLNTVLGLPEYSGQDSAVTRLAFCIQYVTILQSLHSVNSGPRVMCDSNDLNKILQQFLLTSDLQIVLNDMDALPQVIRENNNKNLQVKIKCGHRQLRGDFVAPEQLWPHENRPFSDNDMPSYDEKIDIWRVPDVCNFILGDVEGSDLIQLHLFQFHKQCKAKQPEKRPNTTDILHQYNSVLKTFSSQSNSI